jgi:hypothetical protein
MLSIAKTNLLFFGSLMRRAGMSRLGWELLAAINLFETL